jgi:lysophospholipase L1-like esterase
LQVTLVNLARAGALTPQALPANTPPAAGRPAPDPAINIDRALAQAPRLLVLAFPSNDAVAGLPAAETVAHLSRLRELAAAQSASTILLSSQPRDGLTATQQATLDETDRLGAASFGECFVDVRAALAGVHGGIAAAYAAGDGVHLNDAGHRLIADRLWALLASGRCVRLSAP